MSVTALRAVHGKYKAKCGEAADLRAENEMLRREVARLTTVIREYNELVHMAELVLVQHQVQPGPAPPASSRRWMLLIPLAVLVIIALGGWFLSAY